MMECHLPIMAQHACKCLNDGLQSLTRNLGLVQEYFGVIPRTFWPSFAALCLLQLRLWAQSTTVPLMLYVLRVIKEQRDSELQARFKSHACQLEDLRIGLGSERSYHARIVYLLLSIALDISEVDVKVHEELKQLAWLDPHVAEQAAQLFGISIQHGRSAEEEPLVDRQLKLVHVYAPTWHKTPSEKLHRLTGLFLRSLRQTRESFHSTHEDPSVFMCPAEETLTAGDLDEFALMLEEEKEQDAAFQVCATFPLPVPKAPALSTSDHLFPFTLLEHSAQPSFAPLSFRC
eukprot:GGOE01036502.1.p1 GENE.GGOE01036502.1~~GGOE01036502.1.p1  ORF type:complete len:289 (-),score=27.21 GGOE01036502.1:171-1037(-)